jgi:hypothetical protein
MVEPMGQCGAALGIVEQFDAVANLGEGHGADVKLVQRLGRDEVDH